jgi:hypothetical protein
MKRGEFHLSRYNEKGGVAIDVLLYVPGLSPIMGMLFRFVTLSRNRIIINLLFRLTFPMVDTSIYNIAVI